MKLVEYLRHAIDKKMLGDKIWYYSVFAEVQDSTKYVKVVKGDKGAIKRSLIVDDEVISIEDISYGDIIFDAEHPFNMPSGMLNNDKDVETTLGEFVTNYVLIYIPFGNKIPYVTNKDGFVDIAGVYENVIIPDLTNGAITQEEFDTFGINATFLRSLANLFVISSTEKAIVPPKGIVEFRKKRIREYKKKYGDDVFKDKVKIAALESELIDYIKEYLKDDPSYGISLTGGVIGNSLKKRWGVFGHEDGIIQSEEGLLIENSLMEGQPKSKDQIVAAYNSARTASYFRGNETRVAGVISDTFTNAFTGLKSIDKDCGVKYGYNVLITEHNYIYYIGRQYKSGGKWKYIDTRDEAKELIGRTIESRTPSACLYPVKSVYCNRCLGRVLSSNQNKLFLASLDMGKGAMVSKLKKMHVSGLSSIRLSLDDLI
jgi:hypothetical protein